MTHDLFVTAELASSDDLLRRKQREQEELSRPLERAASEEHELGLARARYWELIAEFVERARDLEVPTRRLEAPVQGREGGRVVWVEGYPLTGGGIVSAPPLQYCTARDGLIRRRLEQQEVEELSLFVVPTGDRGGAGVMAQQTASGGNWPPVRRLDKTAALLTALQRELEASLLALMS